MPKVSFITGVKNRSSEFKEMIQSLIDQDLTDWEAIIVDDNSDEPIAQVVKEFNDTRLKYFRLPKCMTGISNARNYAVERARTELLLNADGDDINKISRASLTYKEMRDNNYDVFYSAMNNYYPSSNLVTHRNFQPYSADLLKMYNFITNPSSAYRKSVFNNAGKYDSSFVISEDYDLWLRMQKVGAKFGYTKKVLVNYRCSEKSLSHEKAELAHKYIMQTRVKNNILPLNINDVVNYAHPGYIKNILSKNNIKLWKDDRYK